MHLVGDVRRHDDHDAIPFVDALAHDAALRRAVHDHDAYDRRLLDLRLGGGRLVGSVVVFDIVSVAVVVDASPLSSPPQEARANPPTRSAIAARRTVLSRLGGMSRSLARPRDGHTNEGAARAAPSRENGFFAA